jgi:hypothetical protein
MARRSGRGHVQGITGAGSILRLSVVGLALAAMTGGAGAQPASPAGAAQAEPPPFSPAADAPVAPPPPVSSPRPSAPPPAADTPPAQPPLDGAPSGEAPSLPELPPPSPAWAAAGAASAPAAMATWSPPPPTLPAGRSPASDPQADRVLLLPTAYTHPQGTVFVSNYEVLVFQLGYAITDATQISLTTLPLPSESLMVLDLSLKTAVVRTDLVRAAAIGSVSGIVGKEVGALFLGRAGGVVQLCVGRRCDSSLSLSSNVVLAGPLMLMVNGVGGIMRASQHVSLIGELSTMVPLGMVGGEFNGGVAGGGVRLHFDHWAFDFSLLHALETDNDAATVPFVTVTYRSSP